MPSELQKGRAVLFGIKGNLGIEGSGTASGFASFIWDTVKAQHKFKIHDVEDEDEADTAAVSTNEHFEIDIKFTPSAATRAAVAAACVFLEPLSKVTLSGFTIAAFNGDYQYRGDQAIDLSKALGTMMLKLRRYADATQNASLVETVSG